MEYREFYCFIFFFIRLLLFFLKIFRNFKDIYYFDFMYNCFCCLVNKLVIDFLFLFSKIFFLLFLIIMKLIEMVKVRKFLIREKEGNGLRRKY